MRLPGLPVAATFMLLLSACGGGEDDGRGEADVDTATAGADSARAESPRLVSYSVVGGPEGPAVERVLRSPVRLASELVSDSVGNLLTFDAVVRSDGRLQSVTFEPSTAAGGFRPAVRTTLHLEGELAVREVQDGDSVRADTMAVPEGVLPWLPESVALLEQIVLRARVLEGDTVTVPLLHVSSGDDAVSEGIVVWHTPDSATLRVEPDDEIRLSLESDGRLARMENLHRGLTASRRQ